MEISYNTMQINQQNTPIKLDFSQKISQEDVKEIKQQLSQQTEEMMLKSFDMQKNLSQQLTPEQQFDKDYKEFQSFLHDIGYESGKSISELSQEEAKKLVSEDGIFGVEQTSQRIADFIIKGANGDEDLMRAGREGMLQGFQKAQEIWKDELPEISQETMKEATKKVDLAMADLGFSIIDKQV